MTDDDRMTDPRPTIIDNGTLDDDLRQWKNERAAQAEAERYWDNFRAMRQCRAQAEADDAAWLADPKTRSYDEFERAVLRWVWPFMIVAPLAVIGVIIWRVWG